MITSLAIATHGHLPCRTPLSLASMGLLGPCEGGGKKKTDKGFYRIPAKDFGVTDDDIIRSIRESETEKKEILKGDTIVDYDSPLHQNNVPPLVNPKPLNEIQDNLDRALAIELRIAEIKRHARIEQLYAEELRKLEEELLVLLLLI